MATTMLNGDEAMAWGALAAGIKIVTSYPGSPSSGTVDVLIELGKEHNLYVEWSTNEKVAMEMGIGASIAGRRALVCVKSVGLNLTIDPLMALNLTPVNAGLVILLGDDPGGYGSQNDQDSRPLASLLEMPMMEPATPQEAYTMMQEAFEVSEKYQVAVIVRETRSFTQQVESVEAADEPYKQVDQGLVREPYRFVPVPINAVAKHKALHETLDRLIDWGNETSYNRVCGTGDMGIVGGGFAYQKIRDLTGDAEPKDFRLLKLGNLYPLPAKVITEFLNGCREILIVEENSPFLETHIKALAQENGCMVKIYGKLSGHLPQAGEMYRWQIQQAITKFMPGFVPVQDYRQDNEAEEKPKKEGFCGNCRYDEVLDKLDEAAGRLGKKPVIIGDPGCLVTVADRLDAKYAIGSAVGVADGLSKAGCREPVVAMFGDSAFFHTTLPAVCNAVCNRSEILMVVLDNKSTVTSGHQPNPGVGKNACGESAPRLDIERITRACGVKNVFTCDLDDIENPLEKIFYLALNQTDLTLIIVRIKKK
ncbi:MAG: hypothetical protein GY869_04135 [Planctomycetes bacterium]|nr:hypothetical protein [Planctomycetota bacterium]